MHISVIIVPVKSFFHSSRVKFYILFTFGIILWSWKIFSQMLLFYLSVVQSVELSCMVTHELFHTTQSCSQRSWRILKKGSENMGKSKFMLKQHLQDNFFIPKSSQVKNSLNNWTYRYFWKIMGENIQYQSPAAEVSFEW